MDKTWTRGQLLIRHELIQARSELDHTKLRSIVEGVLDRYEAHYRARSILIRSDPAVAFSSAFATNLERAIYWVSGWRPNTLIHLLYSESGLQFEAQLNNILSGVHSGDIGDISPAQLRLIDKFQKRTIADEIEIDEELGWIQESAPDPFPPSDSDLDMKMERIGQVMEKADSLRMRTLRGVVGILDPLQAVDLLLAVADWEVGVRGLGLEMDRCSTQF